MTASISLSILGLMYGIILIAYMFHYINEGYWNGIWKNLLKLTQKKSVTILILLISTIPIILICDLYITTLSQHLYNTNVKVANFMDLVSFVSEGWCLFGMLFSLIFISSILNINQIAIILKISLMSSVFAGIFNMFIKSIFSRQRPNVELNPLNFFHMLRNLTDFKGLEYAHNSMSSGHTITIVAAMVPIILYSKQKKYKILFASLAALVGISRIYTFNHWLNDVYVATILGILIGVSCYNINKMRFESNKIKN